jgi:hypothetical protein
MTRSKSPYSAAYHNLKKRGGRAKTTYHRGSGAGSQRAEHLIVRGKKSPPRHDRQRREAGGALTAPQSDARWNPIEMPLPQRGSLTGIGEAASGHSAIPPESYWESPSGFREPE